MSAALSPLQLEIKLAQDTLNKRLDEIGNLKQDAYVNIFYYIIIVGAMLALTYVILSDMWRVLRDYEDSNKVPTPMQERKNAGDTDDYVYEPPADTNANISKEIVDSLKDTDANIKEHMRPITEFKARHDLDAALYTKTGVGTLSPRDDSYAYDPDRAGDGYWSMLFQKPVYHSVLNSDPRHNFA